MTLLKRSDDVGRNLQKTIELYQQAGSKTALEDTGKIFGLNLGQKATDKAGNEINKNPSLWDKAKSYMTSGAMGVSDTGAGIVQGVAYVGDKVNKGINKVFGTNLETNAYGKYNKQYKEANEATKVMRQEARRTGGDWVRTGAEIATTTPTFFVGGGSTLAGRATVQAGIGGAIGASRYAEDSKERLGNIAGGAIGGAVGQVVGEKVIAPVVGKVATKVARHTANKTGATSVSAIQLVDNAISATGITVSQAERQTLVRNATKALKKGKKKDAEAMVRQTLLRRNNIQGTQAQISRNPTTWANEREIAKHNSDLNNVHITNHQQMDDLMRQLIDDTGSTNLDNYQKMENTFETLRQVNDTAKHNISSLYDTAKQMTGNDVPLNHMRFINNATLELQENLLGSFVKGDTMSAIKGMFNDPEFKLTYQKAEELIKIINNRINKTTDGNERYALGIVRKNLEKEVGQTVDDLASRFSQNTDNLPMNPHSEDIALLNAKKQWSEARNAYREHTQMIESTPAMQGAINDVAPDKAFDKYVLRANERDLIALTQQLKKTPQGQQDIKDLQGSVIEHFLSRATKANDGAFSPAQLSRAIDSFGHRKLQILFSPQQIARLNDIKQVADILLKQPLGAHVNHSNTGHVLIKQLLGLTGLVGRVPMVGTIGNIMLGGAKTAGDLAKGGQAYRMMNGDIPVLARNSILGLTPEQLRKIGISKDVASRLSSAVGAETIE